MTRIKIRGKDAKYVADAILNILPRAIITSNIGLAKEKKSYRLEFPDEDNEMVERIIGDYSCVYDDKSRFYNFSMKIEEGKLREICPR